MKATKFIEQNSLWYDTDVEEIGGSIEVVPITVAHEAVKMAMAEFIHELEGYDSYGRVFAALRDKRHQLKIKSK